MTHPRKSHVRALTTALTTTLVSLICMLVLSPPAWARVTIVPGTVEGGATETFAVRLANERPDVPTTRLELTFPADLPIPLVEVAPTDGWDVTVDMRPLDPPVEVDGRTVDEVVSSIVWEGGEVGPRQFEQFLVTAGPLPADGRLVFGVVQGYADGSVDRWTEPASVPDAAGAPTIELVPDPAAPPAAAPEVPAAGPDVAPAAPAQAADSSGSSDGILWAFLAGVAVLLGAGAVVAHRVVGRRKPVAEPAESGARVDDAPLERTGGR